MSYMLDELFTTDTTLTIGQLHFTCSAISPSASSPRSPIPQTQRNPQTDPKSSSRQPVPCDSHH